MRVFWGLIFLRTTSLPWLKYRALSKQPNQEYVTRFTEFVITTLCLKLVRNGIGISTMMSWGASGENRNLSATNGIILGVYNLWIFSNVRLLLYSYLDQRSHSPLYAGCDLGAGAGVVKTYISGYQCTPISVYVQNLKYSKVRCLERRTKSNTLFVGALGFPLLRGSKCKRNWTDKYNQLRKYNIKTCCYTVISKFLDGW